MNQFLSRFFVVIVAVVFTVPSFLVADDELPPVDYTNPANWVVYTPIDKADKPFDVFYIYPTLNNDKTGPLLPWNGAIKEKVIDFSSAQLSGFTKYANVYCPYVRQVFYPRIIDEMKLILGKTDGAKEKMFPLNESFAAGVIDSIAAFQYYLTHLNHGRPFILFGHSQGALDLANVLITNPNISVENGFVAAYLIGIPISSDTSETHLPLAKGRDDIGVVISWNAVSPDAESTLFTGKGTYCMNPVNWRTDATPASPAENLPSVFFNFKTKTLKRVSNCCGARVDPGKGALVVTDLKLPPDLTWAGTSLITKGDHHLSEIWFFYDAIVDNARLRVQKWLEKYSTNQ